MLRAIRPFVLTLMTGIALLLPATATAGSASCDGLKKLTIDEFTAPDAELRLRLTFAPDGTVQVRGLVDLRSARLVPVETRDGARATCADLDEDGRSGLARLVAEFQDSASGERVRVALTPTAHDMAVSGTYTVEVQVGESGMIGDIRTVISGEA